MLKKLVKKIIVKCRKYISRDLKILEKFWMYMLGI